MRQARAPLQIPGGRPVFAAPRQLMRLADDDVHAGMGDDIHLALAVLPANGRIMAI